MEKIKIKVTKNRRYIIPKEYQAKYGFLPGNNIVYIENGEKCVIGKVV